jgi:hypothetical protein
MLNPIASSHYDTELAAETAFDAIRDAIQRNTRLKFVKISSTAIFRLVMKHYIFFLFNYCLNSFAPVAKTNK